MVAKLYFRYGAVSSAKTLNLLAVAHNYERQGKKVIVAKPCLDDRFGNPWIVSSRAPLRRSADYLFGDDVGCTPVNDMKLDGVSCVLVDEAQFLTEDHVLDLRHITFVSSVPVICYGLRTDFRTRLFPGSQRLLELADSIEEVKTTCCFCNRKAVFNMRYKKSIVVKGGEEKEVITPVLDGPQVQLGADETYMSTCYGCYPHAKLME